jgi:hypothetical protein
MKSYPIEYHKPDKLSVNQFFEVPLTALVPVGAVRTIPPLRGLMIYAHQDAAD